MRDEVIKIEKRRTRYSPTLKFYDSWTMNEVEIEKAF